MALIVTAIDPCPPRANAVIGPATSASLEYDQRCSGHDAAAWIQATANEIGLLAQGNLPHTAFGTDTVYITYMCIVASIRPKKAETKRTRFTVGGNLIAYPGDVSTPMTGIATTKCLFHRLLFTTYTKLTTIDTKGFYLNTPMEQYEYIRIPVNVFPACTIMQQYQFASLVNNGHVLVEICMYGLPQSGKLANDHLVQHLSIFGYVPPKHTPCPFTHTTRPILFSLVVDDFRVQYTSREHAQHLATALESLYTITPEWSGTRYLVLTLDWEYASRTVDMTMPGYITQTLTKSQY
jgi:hypothetical protein